ncbi:hypothetical protein [Bartonella machadoae]|uniref:hypothetical protein n=1 Tax=Bartonella machadoae TaxID=2893471 RepID=UPI001F4C8442|nr:hypothetical protein [Bartonella machadoae]UNE54000.1 hypothetical protein LNM86_10615 [Bartonella machadoae]
MVALLCIDLICLIFSSEADFFADKNVVEKVLALHFIPPPGASALALVFWELENTESESAFLLLVLDKHLDRAKAPRIMIIYHFAC